MSNKVNIIRRQTRPNIATHTITGLRACTWKTSALVRGVLKLNLNAMKVHIANGQPSTGLNSQMEAPHPKPDVLKTISDTRDTPELKGRAPSLPTRTHTHTLSSKCFNQLENINQPTRQKYKRIQGLQPITRISTNLLDKNATAVKTQIILDRHKSDRLLDFLQIDRLSLYYLTFSKSYPNLGVDSVGY